MSPTSEKVDEAGIAQLVIPEQGEPALPPLGVIVVQEWVDDPGGLFRRFAVLTPCPINFYEYRDGVLLEPVMYVDGVVCAEMKISPEGKVSPTSQWRLARLMRPTSDPGLVQEAGSEAGKKIVTRVATDAELRELMQALVDNNMQVHLNYFTAHLNRAIDKAGLQFEEYLRAKRIASSVASGIDAQE